MLAPARFQRHVLGLGVLALSAAAGCDSPRPERPSAPPLPPAVIVATTPAPAPPPPSPDAPAHPLRILVGGDLIPHRPSLVAPVAIETALSPLAGLFAKADAVIANFEAATGEVEPHAARLEYAAPRGWLERVGKAGIHAVTVANNHACDLGDAGLEATLDEAKNSGLLALGADRRDPWAPRIVAEQGGHKICAVAWTSISNAEGACGRGHHLAVAPLNVAGKRLVTQALARARAECDATIAIFHGGNEYAPQTTLVLDHATHAAESGADAVVIHHPHIASPVVVVRTHDNRRVPVFASIGNLVTNQGESWKPPMFPVLSENRRLVCVNGWTRLGVLADLSFSFPAPGETHLDWGMHLLWIENEHATAKAVAVPKIDVRLLDPQKDKGIIDKLSEDHRGPLALFSDPCWTERGAGDEHCSTPAGMQPNAPPYVPTAPLRRSSHRHR